MSHPDAEWINELKQDVESEAVLDFLDCLNRDLQEIDDNIKAGLVQDEAGHWVKPEEQGNE